MLYLPEQLPAATTLLAAGHEIATYPPHTWRKENGDVKRILLLNLMPQKAVTELDIARMLTTATCDVQLIPMKISGQSYKTTPIEHMEAFYTDFEVLESHQYEGLIITGAPVEQISFEEVRYWTQLCDIMEWAKTHVRSTLYICWAAQAGLYHHYNMPKYPLEQKKFGIFSQQILTKQHPLFQDFEPCFPMPHSRHTEVRSCDIPANTPQLIEAVRGDETGVGILIGNEGREVYITGHLEYEPYTLHREYERDLSKGLPIQQPQHYYHHDDATQGVNFSWEQSAKLFYRNWVQLATNI